MSMYSLCLFALSLILSFPNQQSQIPIHLFIRYDRHGSDSGRSPDLQSGLGEALKLMYLFKNVLFD